MTTLDKGTGRMPAITDPEENQSESEPLMPGGDPTITGSGSEPTTLSTSTEEDINRVAEVLGRTGGAANHPDGPGVGGD